MIDFFKQVLILSMMGSVTFLAVYILRRTAASKLRKTWVYRVYVVLAALWCVPYWLLSRFLVQTVPPSFSETAPITTVVENFRTLGTVGMVVRPAGEMSSQSTAFNWFTMLMAVWALGAALLLIRFAVSYVGQSRRITKGCIRVTSLETCLQECLAEMPAALRVQAYMNPQLQTPVLLGLFRYRIVLPNIDFPEAELKLIFRHELTHLKRRDNWLLLLAYVISCLHWFNPVAHLFRQELQQQCEDSCDEIVARGLSTQERKLYSYAILNVVRQTKKIEQGTELNGFLTLCREKDDLKMRIENILRVKTRQKKMYTLLAVLLIGCICLGGGVIAAAMSADEGMMYTESRYLGLDDEGRPTATLVLHTPEGELALADYHTDSFDGIWNEVENIEAAYLSYLPAEWLVDPNPHAEFQMSVDADGVARQGLLLDHAERVTYFNEDGQEWRLKRGDKVVLTLTVDKLDAQWPSQGELAIGYNYGGKIFDLMTDTNVIKHFQIEGTETVSFQVPKDGDYSFAVECFASEAFLIEEMQIVVN